MLECVVFLLIQGVVDWLQHYERILTDISRLLSFFPVKEVDVSAASNE